MRRASRFMLFLLCAALSSCSCSKLHGEVDSLSFTRCAQVDAPEERAFRAGTLELEVHERVLSIKPRGELRIAAFTGPIGGPLSRSDLTLLAQTQPGLVLYLGGLGDTEDVAVANLASLAALHVPTIFIAGGGDRWPVVESAFDEVEGNASDLLIQASGLRELRIGSDRFAVVAGSPLGRYAIDGDACGFEQDDLDQVKAAIEDDDVKGQRVWLLSWGAPAGWGISSGFGRVEVGSTELNALAQAVHARGGLFAYPETQTSQPSDDAKRGGLAMVVPRLGRTGSTRADGGRLPSAVATFVLSDKGLVQAAR